MQLPSQSQVAAVGRHVLSYAMGATTAAAALHLLTSDQASTITTSVTEISNGVAQIAAGLAPLIAIATGMYAAWTASRKNQIAAVNTDKGNGVKVVADNVANAHIPMVQSPLAIPPASAAGK